MIKQNLKINNQTNIIKKLSKSEKSIKLEDIFVDLNYPMLNN